MDNIEKQSSEERAKRARMRAAGVPFLCCGVVFLVLGIAGNPTFTAIGLPLLTLGIVFLAQARRRHPSQGGN